MTTLKKIIKSYGWFLIIPVLYFSGIFSQLSSLTQSAVLHAGFADATPVAIEPQRPFDYNFTIKDLEGNKIDFSKYKGKVVFINLWATWCPPCRSEMPSIQKVYDEIDKSKIEFVMLSLDEDEHVDKVKKFITKNSYTFPVFMPSGGLNEQLNVPSIPTTYVISSDGNIVYKEIGMKNYNTSKFKQFLHDQTIKH